MRWLSVCICCVYMCVLLLKRFDSHRSYHCSFFNIFLFSIQEVLILPIVTLSFFCFGCPVALLLSVICCCALSFRSIQIYLLQFIIYNWLWIYIFYIFLFRISMLFYSSLVSDFFSSSSACCHASLCLEHFKHFSKLLAYMNHRSVSKLPNNLHFPLFSYT